MAYSADTFTYAHTNAGLKEWTQRFLDLMTASGWVQTSDTGQVVPSAITQGNESNAIDIGYMVFVQDDSYRAADPIYVKALFSLVDGGWGSTGQQYKSIQINLTIGFSTDGAGGITGNKISTGVCGTGQGYAVNYKTSLDVFAGGDGWATIFHGIGLAATGNEHNIRQICALSIYRLRDINGDVIPGSLYVAYPESARNNSFGGANYAFRPSIDSSGQREGSSMRLLGAYLPKAGAVVGPTFLTPGIIGTPATSGAVEGVVQAQPTWIAAPQIAPFSPLVLVPSSVFSVLQEFTVAIDGVSEHKYACLGIATYATSIGATWAIDCFSGANYCFAARIE